MVQNRDCSYQLLTEGGRTHLRNCHQLHELQPQQPTTLTPPPSPALKPSGTPAVTNNTPAISTTQQPTTPASPQTSMLDETVACLGDVGHSQLAMTLAGPDMASRDTELVHGPYIFKWQLYLPIVSPMVTQLLTNLLNAHIVAVIRSRSRCKNTELQRHP